MNIIDIKDKTFGKLKAIRFYEKRGKKQRHYWLFQCDCGNTKVINKDIVMRGQTKSCGCLASKLKSERKLTHGYTGTKVYNTWTTMKQRCNNPNNSKYYAYGGRGITLCERWSNFENFLNDMGEPPTEKHSIDRIDNDGNYEPSNCRWAEIHIQANNTRNNLFIEYQGKVKTLSQWCLEKNIVYSKALHRYNKGYNISTILEDRDIFREDLQGCKNKRAKFDKKGIIKIILLYNAGVSITKLAKKYQVDFMTIKKILTGASYKDVNYPRPLYPSKMEIVEDIEDTERGAYGSTDK